MSKKNNIKKMLNSDKHERYRSYKRKKTWMYATITGIASVLGGGSIGVPMIKADTTSTGDSQAKEIDSSEELLVNQNSTTIPSNTSQTGTVRRDGPKPIDITPPEGFKLYGVLWGDSFSSSVNLRTGWDVYVYLKNANADGTVSTQTEIWMYNVNHNLRYAMFQKNGTLISIDSNSLTYSPWIKSASVGQIGKFSDGDKLSIGIDDFGTRHYLSPLTIKSPDVIGSSSESASDSISDSMSMSDSDNINAKGSHTNNRISNSVPRYLPKTGEEEGDLAGGMLVGLGILAAIAARKRRTKE